MVGRGATVALNTNCVLRLQQTKRPTTLVTERSARLARTGSALTAPPSGSRRGDKCRNYSHAWACVCVLTCFNFAEHTMNQTPAKAINKERHYGNERVELVRSPPSCMLSHDSGQRFSTATDSTLLQRNKEQNSLNWCVARRRRHAQEREGEKWLWRKLFYSVGDCGAAELWTVWIKVNRVRI